MARPSGFQQYRNATFALVAMLLVGAFAPLTANATQRNSLQSELTDVTIAWNAPYSLMPELGFSDDSVEMIAFEGSADILAIGFLPALIDLNAARDIILDGLVGDLTGFATIDRGSYSGVSYSLDMLNIDGTEMGVFSLFMNQRVHGFAEFYIFIAPPALSSATMQTVQDSITIDGANVLNGIDAKAMGDLVVANVGVTGGTAATDVESVTSDTTKTESSTTRTTRTSKTSDLPATETNVVNAEDAVDYLATIEAQRQGFFDSLTTFNDAFALGDNPSDEDILNARDTSIAEANYWLTFEDAAMGLIPPPGYEDVQSAYDTYAQEVTVLGEIWIDTMNQGNSTVDDFNSQLDSLEEADQALLAEIAATGEAGSGSQTSSQNSAETDSPRSTRSVADENPTAESSSRTTRTTRSSDTDTSGSDQKGTASIDPRTSRTTTTNTGNSSETSGRVGSTSVASSSDNSLVMEQNGLTITWGDSFAPNEDADPPTRSDSATGEDKISLQLNRSTGSSIPFNVTVLPNTNADSTFVIRTLERDQVGLEEFFGDDAEIIYSVTDPDMSAMLVRATDEQGGFWVLLQFTCVSPDCSTIAMLYVDQFPQSMIDVIWAMEVEPIEIDGRVISGAFPAADVQDSIEGFGN